MEEENGGKIFLFRGMGEKGGHRGNQRGGDIQSIRKEWGGISAKLLSILRAVKKPMKQWEGRGGLYHGFHMNRALKRLRGGLGGCPSARDVAEAAGAGQHLKGGEAGGGRIVCRRSEGERGHPNAGVAHTLLDNGHHRGTRGRRKMSWQILDANEKEERRSRGGGELKVQTQSGKSGGEKLGSGTSVLLKGDGRTSSPPRMENLGSPKGEPGKKDSSQRMTREGLPWENRDSRGKSQQARAT